MARINITPADYAGLSIVGATSDEVVVKQLAGYVTASDAHNALNAYRNETGPDVTIPMPNGENRQFTRGEILFALDIQRSVVIALRRVTIGPLPWFPY